MSIKTVCEDMFLHAYKQALKEENPFESFEETFKKLEKVFGTFRSFNNLLQIAKAYEIELPKEGEFSDIFLKVLKEVLAEFYKKHSEQFPSISEEEFLKFLTDNKNISIFSIPQEVEDVISLITALEVDGITSEVYTTTRIKRIIGELSKE
jgi:hypothetical protein